MSRFNGEAKQIFRELKEKLDRGVTKTLVAGFDGFVDTTARPIRQTATESSPAKYFETIEEFGMFLASKAKKSCSVELLVESKNPGGNMPYLARGAAALGFCVSCIGMLGEGQEPDPVFRELPGRKYSFSQPGESMCLEFMDGKVMLAPGVMISGDPWKLVEQATDNQASEMIRQADVLALVNWSEMSFSQELWEQVYENAFGSWGCDKEKLVFFDLCDITRKSREEIQEVLGLIDKYSQKRKTILSMNENEAIVIGQRLLTLDDDIEETGRQLRSRFGVDEVLIHTLEVSILITPNGVWKQNTYFVEHPKRSTGAGDHFNAASCYAAAFRMGEEERLVFANRFVSLYLETGISPGLDAVMED